jgi:hypothetical protein
MAEPQENRDYTPLESSFSTDFNLGGGLTSQVDKVEQELDNKEEVAKRNETLAEGNIDNQVTMEPDTFKFSLERDKALKKTALKSNWFFDWLDEAERSDRFAQADTTGDSIEIKDTLAHSILNEQRLPQEYMPLIKGSKTIDGLQARVDWAKEDAETNGYIGKALTEKEIMLTTVASSLATPDVVVGIGAPALLYKTAKTAQSIAKGSKVAQVASSTPFIAGAEYGTETAINFWHSAVSDEYNMMDAAIDTLIYGTAGTSLTRFVTPKNMEEVAENGRVSKSFELPAPTERLLLPAPKTAEVITPAAKAEAKAVDDIVTEVVSPAEKQAQRNIQIKQEEAREFRKQTIEAPKQKQSEIQAKIDAAKAKLDEAVAEPTSTKSKITRRTKAIAKLEKEIEAVNEELRLIDEGHSKTMKEYSDKIIDIQKSIDEAPKKAEVDEMFNHYLAEPKQHIKAIEDFVKTNPDKEYLEGIRGHVEGIRSKFPDEVKAIEDMISSKVGNTKVLKTEWYKKLSPHNKKILVTAGVLGATGASASDGDDAGTMATALLLTVLAVFGLANRQAIHALATSKTGVGGKMEGLKKSWAKATTGIVHEEGMNNAGKWRKSAAAIAEKAYSQLFSTSAPFLKAGGSASEFIQKMLYNKDFGGGAMTMKNEWFKAAIADYNKSETANFRLWMQEKGITEDKILNNTNEMEVFRELVLDVKEGLVKSDSKAVNDVVKLMNDKFADMLIANKEYKTHGFEKVTFTPNYVPRLWRTALIQDALKTMTDNQVEAFTDVLAKSIKSKGARKIAEKLVQGWRTAGQDATANAKSEVIAMLSDKNVFKEGEEVDDILDAITGVKDRTNRAKFRIDMDMKVLKEGVDGLGIKGLTFNAVLDRSSASVIDKLGNQMYSSAALSREGITSMTKLDNMILKVAEQDGMLGRQAKQIKSLVMGEPMPVDNDFLHTISNAMKDITLGGKLPLVALSTPTEIIQTLFSNGFFNGLNNIGKAMSSKYGKGSEMVNQLAKIGSLGRGTDLINLKYAHRGFSNEFVESGETAFSQFREGTMRFRDLIVYFSGLSGITDLLQLANKIAHTEELGRIANGMENGIPLERYTEFGISEARMKALKPYMVFDENEVLQKVDLEAMPRKVKDDYQEMMFNMNQAITPETTVGETPLFARTSSLGRIITTLVAYPMQQFNLHGIQGIKRADKYSAIQFMGGIGGTYIGLNARNELMDKGMDEDTILMYSMMNAPQGLGISAVKSFFDPAVVNHNKQLMQLGGY